MEAFLLCPNCDGRGHMNDSRAMDNGYGKWWQSTPTKCAWCEGAGKGPVDVIAARMIAKLETDIAVLETRLLDKQIELANYRAAKGE